MGVGWGGGGLGEEAEVGGGEEVLERGLRWGGGGGLGEEAEVGGGREEVWERGLRCVWGGGARKFGRGG